MSQGTSKSTCLCLFPRAAARKYYKLGGLEQWKCILSQFWMLEVWNQGVSGPCYLWSFLGKVLLSLMSFQEFLGLWQLNSSLSPTCHVLLLYVSKSFPLLIIPVIGSGAHPNWLCLFLLYHKLHDYRDYAFLLEFLASSTVWVNELCLINIY